MVCAWCLYKETFLHGNPAKNAVTMIAGDALCHRHFLHWARLKAYGSWYFPKVIELLKKEKP